MSQTVRIIGGTFRGKKIHFPDMDGLRPTPDRVRETVFNWLMHDIHDTHCLDAFAGSGALGMEALSRGAGRVVFIEQDRRAFACLKKNVPTLSPASKTALVHHENALHFMRQTKETFDIIFLDPPFSENLVPECLEIIRTSGCLKKNGFVYVECPGKLDVHPNYWKIIKQKQAGQVFYALIELSEL